MKSLTAWLDTCVQSLTDTFGDRLWFVGLQGSHSRGEATATSDIDLVVILDPLSPVDIQTYRAMLDTLPNRALVCGFLSGKEELLCWEPSDLFQFYHDTTPIRGSLDDLLTLIDQAAVQRAIKLGACNIYHGCVHNMVHAQSEEVLLGLYKAASFVLQAIAFRQTGEYLRYRADLLPVLSPEDRAILTTFVHLKQGGAADFSAMSQALFVWAKEWIGKTE